MKVVIIGGKGFIGSHLTKFFRTHGHDVFTYDLMDQQDARLPIYLEPAIRGADLVVHLAANADIAKAAAEPEIDFYNGTLITHRVLESMRKNGCKHIVYSSGSGVYGDYTGVPFKEDMPQNPVSPYGASKTASEAMISAYCHMFNMRADVFRFANVVGPRQTHGVGYDFIRRLKADPTKLRILGDGTQRKSYIHVDDIIAAIAASLGVVRDGFDVCNVATEDAITVQEIADMACSVMQTEAAYEFTGGHRGWSGDVPILRMNTDKIRKLGWSPKYTSAQAMKSALLAMKDEI